MRSMTGYGKGVVSDGDKTLTIELKTVNNRYLEINSRLPRTMACCEEVVRKLITAAIKRGSVEVLYSLESGGDSGKTVGVDMGLAAEYVAAAKKLRNEFMLDSDFSTAALLRLPEVVRLDIGRDDPAKLQQMVSGGVGAALEDLNRMREVEGTAIKADLTDKVSSIVAALEQVAARAPQVVTDYRAKVKQRISEFLQGVDVDQARLLNEVAFFADKADINEEISRLSSHIRQFLDCLESDEPQGRRLDFLSQEMNREINTMGSKSNDTALTALVLEMKNDLEKIKEQIRNVE